MSLDEKKNIQYSDAKGIVENQYSERDVKQFIKELKEARLCGKISEEKIEEIFGEGLV